MCAGFDGFGELPNLYDGAFDRKCPLPALIMNVVKRLTWLAIVLFAGICSCNPVHGPEPAGAQRNPSDNRSSPSAGQKSDAAVVNTPPAPPADNRPRVVTFGDSLSAGFGAEPGNSYPDFLQHRINESNKGYRVVNAGVSGDTTTDALQRMPAILAMKPKIVILEFGGNDGLRGLPLATTKANLEKMIQAFQAGGAKVLLAGMTLPRNYGSNYIGKFEQIYVQLANQYHLKRIPFLLEGVAGNSKLMQPDGIHPTADGNKVVAENVYKYLQPML